MKKIALIFLSVFALGVIAAPASATGGHSYQKSGWSYTKFLSKISAKKNHYSVVSGESYLPKRSSKSSKKTRSLWKDKSSKKIRSLWKDKKQELFGRTHKRHSGSTKSVPEIDAASTGIALALLGGIVAIRRERRKA